MPDRASAGRRIRVAHVTTISLSLTSLLQDQMLWLATHGFDVESVSAPGPETSALRRAGLVHHSVAMTRKITPLRDLLSLWQLWRLFRKRKYDIVHTHTPKAGLLGQLAARLAGVPAVVNTVHGLYLDYGTRKVLRLVVESAERAGAKASHRILFQNRESMEFFLSRGLASPGKCVFLGNGIDLSTFDPAVAAREAEAVRRSLSIEPGQPVVGFVGRLAARRKGFDVFLRAALEVLRKRPGTVFIAAGEPESDGSDRVSDALREEAAAAGVRFLGHVENASLPPLYAAMSMLVLPSLFEGLPRVVMEAAALGVPSIVTEVQGNREAVVDGVTGRYVPAGSTDAVVAAIVELLDRPDLRAEMARNVRARAVEVFDQRTVFERVKNCYEELIGGAVAARPSEYHDHHGK